MLPAHTKHNPTDRPKFPVCSGDGKHKSCHGLAAALKRAKLAERTHPENKLAYKTRLLNKHCKASS